MSMNNELTSIQVSVKHRDKLKKHCDQLGCNMNRFVENLIEDNVMKATQNNSDEYDPLLKPLTFLAGTKDEILLYIFSKITGLIAAEDNVPADATSTDIYELRSDPIEEQIIDTIRNGSPILSIIVCGMNFNANSHKHQAIRMSPFFVTDFLEIKTEIDMAEISPSKLKKAQESFGKILESPEFIRKLPVVANIKKIR